MLETGITGTQSLLVVEAVTARAVGSGGLPVFATPAMIALMEATSMHSVQAHLAPGQGTVGTAIDAKHLATTPVGMTVRCQSTLTGIDRRRLVFSIEVYDERELVGTATHERFIVDDERFMEKAQQKLAPATP